MAALVALVLVCGCATPHTLLRRADYETAEEQLENAVAVAEFGGDTGNDSALRCYAFETAGKLGVYEASVGDALGNAVADAGEPSVVRSWAAWAIGEVGRELPWDQRSKKLHADLIRALNGSLSAESAYYVVEALGKMYVQHTHTMDEQIATAEALNTLAARQKGRAVRQPRGKPNAVQKFSGPLFA